MAAGALAGYAVLIAVVFGVRTVVHIRRTGSTGWLRPPTTAASAGDALFVGGIVAVAAGPVLQLVGLPARIELLDRVAVSVAGVVLLGAGGLFAIGAQAQMGAAWRAGIDLSDNGPLIVRGLFRRVRNPFYTGMLTASAGVALMAPSAASTIGCLLMLAGCEVDVRMVEEPHLRSVHGERYASYEQSVPRFVPAPRRRQGPTSTP